MILFLQKLLFKNPWLLPCRTLRKYFLLNFTILVVQIFWEYSLKIREYWLAGTLETILWKSTIIIPQPWYLSEGPFEKILHVVKVLPKIFFENSGLLPCRFFRNFNFKIDDFYCTGPPKISIKFHDSCPASPKEILLKNPRLLSCRKYSLYSLKIQDYCLAGLFTKCSSKIHD